MNELLFLLIPIIIIINKNVIINYLFVIFFVITLYLYKHRDYFNGISKELIVDKLFIGVDYYHKDNRDVLIEKLNGLSIDEKKFLFRLAKKEYSEENYNMYIGKLKKKYWMAFLVSDKIDKPMILKYL